MGNLLPIRAVALLVVAVFGVQLSCFYLVADLADFNCPHHVPQPMGVTPQEAPGTMQHANHAMPQSDAAHPETQSGSDSDQSGMRCCCRHSLDGIITTLLDAPGDLVNAPLPDGVQKISLASGLSVLENDLNPPFIPPRI